MQTVFDPSPRVAPKPISKPHKPSAASVFEYVQFLLPSVLYLLSFHVASSQPRIHKPRAASNRISKFFFLYTFPSILCLYLRPEWRVAVSQQQFQTTRLTIVNKLSTLVTVITKKKKKKIVLRLTGIQVSYSLIFIQYFTTLRQSLQQALRNNKLTPPRVANFIRTYYV